jgi:hypothetical protein
MSVHDTWAARDLPVLDATVSLHEQSYLVTVTDIAERTGLDVSEVARALEALDPRYVDFRKTTTGGDPRFWYVFKVTPEARHVVGQWPTAESLVGRLAEELATAAGQETEPERHGLLIYAARLIGDTLRDIAVQAAGQVLRPAFADHRKNGHRPEPASQLAPAAWPAQPETTAPQPVPPRPNPDVADTDRNLVQAPADTAPG